jgi:hypothetical protein
MKKEPWYPLTREEHELIAKRAKMLEKPEKNTKNEELG